MYVSAIDSVCRLPEPYKSLSRLQAHQWFRSETGKMTSLQDLSTGVMYSQLLYRLYPKAINMKKINAKPRSEQERLVNWQVVQMALHRLKVQKDVQIFELVKTNSAQGLDFCRWFIAFFEQNKPKKTVIPAPAENSSTDESENVVQRSVVWTVAKNYDFVAQEDTSSRRETKMKIPILLDVNKELWTEAMDFDFSRYERK